jgi:N-acetylated-alpha-linked acidic dipeptidase
LRSTLLVLALTAGLVVADLQAQAAPTAGFARGSASRERDLEVLLASVPDTARARRHVWALSSMARVAGTPAQTASADYVLRELAAAGLDTSRSTYRVYLPLQDSAVVERTKPTVIGLPLRLALEEGPLAEDSTMLNAMWPAMNGFSGVGDARGELLYVNYGLPADYDALDSMGVSPRGRVVIARYGQGFRGIKAREAERRGAIALLLYSDPADDGYVRGDVYPAGPMRHFDAVERGAIGAGEGDPATPGRPAHEGADRLPRSGMLLPGIPVVPLSYKNALQLLSSLTRGAIPQSWQGGLPFRYHVGAGEVTMRVGVWADTGAAAFRAIHNTFGVLRGSEFPDEVVIVGAHRDAWGTGASDNASGVTSVLEAARAWGEAARRGMRPKRTLVFATWDAEEWGLIGSTEWVESEAPRLQAHAVAYVNQDMVAHGPTLGVAASPSLHGFAAALAADVAGTPNVTVGDLGSGSDFSPFQNTLGVPSLGYGFGGPHGGYHSAYDTPRFVERFGDPGFRLHARAAAIGAVALARLANAEVVPISGADVAATAILALEALRPRALSARDSAQLARVHASARRLGETAAAFAKKRDARLSSGAPRSLEAVNAALRQADRALVHSDGLPGRASMRNRLVGSQRETRYGAVRLPGLAEALADRDSQRLEREADALVSGLVRAEAAFRKAMEAL